VVVLEAVVGLGAVVGLEAVVSVAVVSVAVVSVAVRWGSSDLQRYQRYPHHQHSYHHSLEIAFDLLVMDDDHQAGLEWGADSSKIVD